MCNQVDSFTVLVVQLVAGVSEIGSSVKPCRSGAPVREPGRYRLAEMREPVPHAWAAKRLYPDSTGRIKENDQQYNGSLPHGS